MVVPVKFLISEAAKLDVLTVFPLNILLYKFSTVLAKLPYPTPPPLEPELL
ncbi:hypothetical protein D3C85_1765560 [compost metagenome]